MSMDVDSLAASIVANYRAEMAVAFPETVKSVTVEQIPKEDGSFEFSTNPVTGPAEVDEAKFLPMARAIAKSVIEHLESSAEAVEPSPGTDRWRIE
jgi:hypothetical protein